MYSRFALIVSLLLLGFMTVGAPLLEVAFSGDEAQLTGWEVKNLGDRSGKTYFAAPLDDSESHPLIISAPNPQSWLFLVKNFSAAQLGDAGKLRLTAWVMSNRPDKIFVAVSEDVEWGGDVTRTFVRHGAHPGVWEKIEIILERSQPDKLLSVALGMDYNSQGAWMAVGAVVVEVEKSEAAFSNLPDALLPETIAIPRTAVDASMNVDLDALSSAWEKERQKISAAGFADHPAVNDRQRKLAALQTQFADEKFVSSQAIRQLNALQDELRQSQIVWRNAGTLQRYQAATGLPPADDTALHVRMPVNAYETVLTLVRNTSGRTMPFQVKLSGDAAKIAKINYLQEIEYTPDFPMPITPDTLLPVADGDTLGIQLEVATQEAAPGEYTGVLELIPLDGAYSVRKMAVTVEVVPVELPARLPIQVFQWDYAISKEPRYRDFLLAARVNTFHVSLYRQPSEEDFADLHAVVNSLLEKVAIGEFQLVIEAWFVRENGGWRQEYNPWLDRLTAALEQANLNYQDWSLEIYDETLNDAFFESARAIKAHNPAVRIFSDCTPLDPTVVDRFAPYLDIWCPNLQWHLPPYSDEYVQSIAAMRATGKPLWVYSCDPRPQQELAINRLQPWFAWLNNFTGCNYWTSNPSTFRNVNEQPNWGFTYRNNAGDLIGSRRWQQWRAGLEDYLLLDMADRRAEARNDKELKNRVRALALQVTGAKDSPDLSRILAEARNELLEILQP